MTIVTYESYYDSCIFHCSGHSEYAEKGCDIVCSAVSVLCYTLDDYLARCHEEGRLKSYKSDFSDGYVLIEFEKTEAYETEISEGVDAILGGFRLLSENYPDYVTADI